MEHVRFFWVATRGNPVFEPAAVDFDKDGRPDQVWFTGMDTSFAAAHCTIAEEIIRTPGKDV